MLPDNQRLSTDERANLVAYLDGELGPEESRRLATKLTRSATARREVDNLERTWELLDFLVRPKVSPDLASRTLTEALKFQDQGGALFSRTRGAALTLARALACLVVMVLSVAAGYVMVRWVWPDPTSRLVRDLSVAEHLDEYRDVGSLEFLQALDNTFTQGP